MRENTLQNAANPSQRLKAGDPAPQIIAPNIAGTEVKIPRPSGGLTHIQFLRFAGCPVCNLHLRDFIKRIDAIRAAGIREVVFFHSEAKFLIEHQGKFPFDVIGDPQKAFYRKYKVASSPWAILSPRAWPALMKWYRVRPSFIPDSSTFGLPADFLIAGDGTIVACHYGPHSGDQWSVDDLLQWAKGQGNGEKDAFK